MEGSEGVMSTVISPDSIYLCDPTRNTECRRSVGGECSNEYCAATAHPEYAQLDEYGKPIKLLDIRSV